MQKKTNKKAYLKNINTQFAERLKKNPQVVDFTEEVPANHPALRKVHTFIWKDI